jgi:hypothetical protein
MRVQIQETSDPHEFFPSYSSSSKKEKKKRKEKRFLTGRTEVVGQYGRMAPE